MEIKENSGLCTVIVTVDGSADEIKSIIDHARKGPKLFRNFRLTTSALHGLSSFSSADHQ